MKLTFEQLQQLPTGTKIEAWTKHVKPDIYIKMFPYYQAFISGTTGRRISISTLTRYELVIPMTHSIIYQPDYLERPTQ